MNLFIWYVQLFNDGDAVYFVGEEFIKNGNMKGVLVSVDAGRPRARPKAKRDTVPQTKHFKRLWTEIAEVDVPEKVRESRDDYRAR